MLFSMKPVELEPTQMFECIPNFRRDGREKQVAACSFLGSLIRSTHPFPYLMLLALETGCLFRALLLLISFPLYLLLRLLSSPDVALQMQVFITFSGLKASTVELFSRTVLAKAYLDDVNRVTLSAFGSFGKKFVVTQLPRIMVEPFLKHYLGVESVVGSELQVLRNGYCTGLITMDSSTQLLTSADRRMKALKALAHRLNLSSFDVGFGNGCLDFPFMAWCKEAYSVVSDSTTTSGALPLNNCTQPLVFHDGRLAVLPTPSMALAIFLWTPFAVLLAILRITVSHLPYVCRFPLTALLGIRIRVRGCIPRGSSGGTLYVCSHRTLLDPLLLASVLKRDITAVTYSISWLSEVLSSIKTARLCRNRSKDSMTMRRLLQTGDVAVCPEGTTCREPYLLRFSPLFAEVSSKIVPVMIYVKTPLFYATTARGRKWLDPFFFCMNPTPSYELEFLEELPLEETCAGGKTSVDVANYVQRQLADASGYRCTRLTRREKYAFLSENHGM